MQVPDVTARRITLPRTFWGRVSPLRKSSPYSGAGEVRNVRSFLALLLTGFIVVSLPLAGALLYSAWNTDRLVESGTNAVLIASRAARTSRLMANQIATIGRLAQQLIVVPNPELQRDYVRLHLKLKRIAGDLAALPIDKVQLTVLDRTVKEEQSLYDMLKDAPQKKVTLKQVRNQVDLLTQNAYDLLAISYLVADRGIARLRSSADNIQRRLVVVVIFAAAIALAVALVLARIITRPISQLEQAIGQLGDREFAHPIRVQGPRDLHRLGIRLDWLRRRLAELEAQTNRFLRHLSHELKTPLTALREGTELLNDRVAGPLAPSQQQVVAIMRENGLKLQKMIEELLDYQRALHAAATLEVKPLHLDALLREVANAHRLTAGAKELRIVLETDPLSIEADDAKLRTIVDNLLSNAVKFAPHKGIVSVFAAAEGDESVVIDVRDTGPGVPEQECEAIFDVFSRGRRKAPGRVEGSGLGLAIVRELVEAHGGHAVAIAGAQGGHFRVTLPKYQRRADVVA